MDQPENKNSIFKYVLYPGNNSAAIQSALANRKVWSSISVQKILSANLVWKPLNFPTALYDQIDELLRYDKEKNMFLNHFENNHLITTKSGLVRSLKHYYSHENSIYQQNYHVFETIPTTFVVNPNKDKGELKDFLERFAELENKNYIKQKMPGKHCEKNIWYIKPEAENQGRGISLSNNIKQIQTIIYSKSLNTSYILQKAIQKPLLYKNRKFDIRIWTLVTANFEIYYYKVPYLRTSSFSYEVNDLSNQIHLTNNAQQKNKSQYSKFEKGNTLPLSCLRDALIEDYQKTEKQANDIIDRIIERMKGLVVDSFLSVRKLFLRNQKKKEFQLFGFDFLIDEDFRTWLIQINNNPYLGTPNTFIKKIIPEMINEMFEIVLDPIFPPVDYEPSQAKNFQLVHKQISFFRINPLRSGSSDNRKNYYPTRCLDNRKFTNSSNKNRRNSQALSNLYSFQSTEKHIKVRYSTPVQSVRYLLDTYCFSDLQPFLVPVNFILTSPKLEQADNVDKNVKNVKMITETRICHILLEHKFVIIAKNLLNSEKIPEEIKVCILSGYFNAIRNHKNRVEVIKNIIPTFPHLLSIHNRFNPFSSQSEQQQPNNNKQQENQEVESDMLVESMIMLLIRLGGTLNRKIFIPGQTRERQNSRELFITSGTLKIFIILNEAYPKLCSQEARLFFDNLNVKDWDLYKNSKENDKMQMSVQECSPTLRAMSQDRSMTESHLQHKSSLPFNYIDEKNHHSSFRNKLETTNIRNFTRQNRVLPKITKF